MIPDLEPPDTIIPRGGIDLGDGYVLLWAQDCTAREIRAVEAAAIDSYLGMNPGNLKITQWAHLRLCNGQMAHSVWKEGPKEVNHICISQNIKV